MSLADPNSEFRMPSEAFSQQDKLISGSECRHINNGLSELEYHPHALTNLLAAIEPLSRPNEIESSRFTC